MRRRQWLSWIIGPGLTVLATVGYDYLIYEEGWLPTVAPLLPFMILAGFLNGAPTRPWDGLAAALLCAAWIAGYSVYLGPVANIERIVLVPASILAMAVIIGVLRAEAWRGEAAQVAMGEMALENNLARLRAIEDLARELYYEWDRLTEAERRERVSWVWDRANNIAALAEGWRQVGRHQYWAKQG